MHKFVFKIKLKQLKLLWAYLRSTLRLSPKLYSLLRVGATAPVASSEPASLRSAGSPHIKRAGYGPGTELQKPTCHGDKWVCHGCCANNIDLSRWEMGLSRIWATKYGIFEVRNGSVTCTELQ